MTITISRATAINIILTLALAVGAVLYILTSPQANSLNAVGAVVVAASAVVLSNNLWK